METGELESYLASNGTSCPPPPPNSPREEPDRDFQFGIVDPRLSLISNLYLSNANMSLSSYIEEEEDEIMEVVTQPPFQSIPNQPQISLQEPFPDIEDLPGMADNCLSFAQSPNSLSYRVLNPEAPPFIPSPTNQLLRAFSAPASPEDGNLEQLIPNTSASPALTRRRHPAGAPTPVSQQTAASPHVSSPPRTGEKRNRTLTTSSCGPDIELVLTDVVGVEYERFLSNLRRLNVERNSVIKKRKFDFSWPAYY